MYTFICGSRVFRTRSARGGYTTVCPMPNLNPVPDDLETLRRELDIIERDAVVETIPYGAITRGERGETLADMEAMAPYVCAFSDDGRGVQDADMMESAMRRARSLNRLIAAHCEDNALLRGGYIHDGAYARAHGHAGICAESEYGPIRRDAAIREARARGVDITCETGPHYLVLNDSMLEEDGRFKMNPPIRSEADRLALLEGILDGTVDMIATDHAPHSAEEKSRGLAGSAMGVVGLETAFPVLYTELVRPGILPLEKLVALMSVNPRRRFGLETRPDDYTVFDLDASYTVDPDEFLTMGRATPFAGRTVYGRCLLTVCRGRVVWQEAGV